MRALIKSSRISALLIFVAMLVHNLNSKYLEPTYLGFENPATDYSNMEKIENALWSFSFISSGISHIVTGFSMMILGLAAREIFRKSSPVAAQLSLMAAMLSGLGFLLTDISDIPGTVLGGMLRAQNPDHNTAILLMSAMFRGAVNIMAVLGLGWFAGELSWSALRSKLFPRWFAYYGYFLVLPGISSLVFPPAGFLYIQLTPLWAIGLVVFLGRLPDSVFARD